MPALVGVAPRTTSRTSMPSPLSVLATSDMVDAVSKASFSMSSGVVSADADSWVRMPTSSMPEIPATSRAISSAGAPGDTPKWLRPVSIFMSTGTSTPAARLAAAMASVPGRLSTTQLIRTLPRSELRTASLCSPKNGWAIMMSSIPASAKASASLGLETQAPIAPAFICRSATYALRWTFMFGLSFSPASEVMRAIVAMLASSLSKSTRMAGVSKEGNGTSELTESPLPSLTLSPNPPKDTDGRREENGRGVRELQGK